MYSQDSQDYDRFGVSERSLLYRESGVTLDGVTAAGAANTASMTGEEYWTSWSAIAENNIYKQDNIRLREFSVGYNVPNASSLGLDSMYVQLVGRNLFYLDKAADDIDPEGMLGNNIGGQGIASGNLPTSTSLGLNLTLKF